jgi:nicotinamide riboside transporter PnuC
MWFVTFLSIIGVVLNIKKNKLCFAIWIFTNATWMIVDFRAGLHAQAFLFAVYTCLAVWGLYRWWRENKSEEDSL